MEDPFKSLLEKLNNLSQGQDIELTALEAEIYGTEYSDQLLLESSRKETENDK